MEQPKPTPKNPGVNESHFYMWRAIFAIAHVDGKIDPEEEVFMDNYLKTVPFNLQQKAILEDDIIHPQDAGEMLSRVTSPQDQGQFFQFARMMCWSDGNYDIQEKEIMERLLGAHMEKLDVPALTQAMHKSREQAEAIKEEYKNYEKEQARKKVGIGPIIANLFARRKDKKLPKGGVSESRFYMWRSIFAMAHADNIITDDELEFMHDVLIKENFTNEQRKILEEDIEIKQDVADLFRRIGDQEDRSQFFYFARMLCWSDGNFDEQEQELMLKLKSLHIRNVDITDMIGTVDMQLDDDKRQMLEDDMGRSGGIIARFVKRFAKS